MTRLPAYASFRVFDACRLGFGMMADHAVALARIGAVPLAIVCANTLLITQIEDAGTPVRNFLFGLPALAATGWMIFASVRLWALGETPAALRDDKDARAGMLQATVIAYILWKALVTAYEQVLALSIPDPAQALQNPEGLALPPGAQILLMAFVGVLLWALRFRAVPVLTALGYPVRDYARRATGFMLSLRLLGLVMVCVEFPRMLIIAPLLKSGLGGVSLLVIGNAVTFVLELWLFAAFTAALRIMMTGPRR